MRHTKLLGNRCPELLLRTAKASFRHVPEVQAARTKDELLVVFHELTTRSSQRADHDEVSRAIMRFMKRYDLTGNTLAIVPA